MPDNAGIEGVLTQNQSSGAGPEILDPGPPDVLPPDAADIVPTKKKRRAPAHTSRINIVAKLRSQSRSLQLKELICEHNFSVSAAARELGLAPRTGRKLWAVWVDRVRRFEDGTADEVKAGKVEVRVYCEHNVQELIQRCMERVDENPAYAAGALRGMELFCKLRGVRLDDPAVDQGNKAAADGLATLEDARKRAGEALGLAVNIEAIDEAEQSVAQSGVMSQLNRELRGLGDGDVSPFRNANKPLVSAQE